MRWLIQTKGYLQKTVSRTQGTLDWRQYEETRGVFTLITTVTPEVPSTQLSVTTKKPSRSSPPAYSSSRPIALLPAGRPHLPLKEPCLFPASPALIPLLSIQMPPILHGPIHNPNQQSCTTQKGSIHKDDDLRYSRVVQHGGPNPFLHKVSTSQQVSTPFSLSKTIHISHVSTGLPWPQSVVTLTTNSTQVCWALC